MMAPAAAAAAAEAVAGDSAALDSLKLESDQLAVVGLDLDEIPASLGAKFGGKTRRLDLSFNNLSALANLEGFRSGLKELVLDNNELTAEGCEGLPELPNLETLTLNKNKIKDTEGLLATVASKCPKLNYLSLLGNKACPNELVSSDKDEEDYQRYRYFVLHKLSSLKFLDSRAVTAEERAEADRVGAFMRIVRPSAEGGAATVETPAGGDGVGGKGTADDGYTPLPPSQDRMGRHSGSFGQARYVYFGKNSEGNRFIRDNDL